MVAHMPGPIAEVVRGLTPAALSTKGMKLEQREPITIDGHGGVLLRLTQVTPMGEYKKLMLVVGNDTEFRMVTAMCPTEHAPALVPVLERVVRTTRVVPVDTSATSDLGFSVAPAGDLKLVSSAAGAGKMLMFTRTGRAPLSSPSDPVFMVSPSIGPATMKDTQAFSTWRLNQLSDTEILKLHTPVPTRIDGLRGWSVIADAKATDSDTAIVVHQTIVYAEDLTYWMMVGMVGVERRDTYVPVFEKMAASLTRKPN